MKLTLLHFQEKTVSDALTGLRLSMDEVSRVGIEGNGQVVTLVAPTGAGKTVMAAAILESILEGDAAHAMDEEATVVWLSDLPNVNEQTRRRIGFASDKLDDSRLVQIDTDFTGDDLPPGRIYFLNTQKLSSTSHLVADAENRGYTIWEIINRTIRRNPSRFILIVDEAHRGMERSASGDSANSIVQRFILGTDDMVRSPIVFGLSATPKRFDDLIAGTTRTVRRAEADIAEVRASGLIKERVVVWRPEHGLVHSEHTLLQRAVQDLQDYDLRWRRYSENQDLEKPVEPILVVQVEDKTADQVSATSLEQAIEAVEEILGPQHPDAFAHSFGDAPAPIAVGGSRRLRYIKPVDIDSDPEIRVVFFKTSLSTGWDCPRAEVMMSFRAARDATSIAQLVGRMVRTPLARRINEDDVLNSVALYLPRYDRAAIQDIIKQLRSGDPEAFAAIDADEGNEVVDCEREETIYAKIAPVVSTLKTYTVPSTRRLPPIRRLERLAGCLSDFDLLSSAPTDAEEALVKVLWDKTTELKKDAKFKEAVEQSRKIGLSATVLSYLTGATQDQTIQVESTARSLERLYDQVGNRVGAGLHEKLWRRLRDGDQDMTADVAHLYVIAVLRTDSALTAVENRAREMFEAWMAEYEEVIDKLREAQREEIDRLRELADSPSTRGIHLPGTIRVRRSARTTDWPKHLYRDADGSYPDAFNEWEIDVLETEMGRAEHVTWLRNRDRQKWAIAFPYDKTTTERAAAYPDFVFFRRESGGIKADLIDPHGIHLPDAPAKARGFATYAKLHGHLYGRIEMVIFDPETKRKRSLNLKSVAIRDQVLNVSSLAHLKALFDIAGS